MLLFITALKNIIKKQFNNLRWYPQGEGLNRGSSQSDYTIMVGLGTCEIRNLFASSVECMPPQQTPEKSPNNTISDHVIMVTTSGAIIT